MDSDDDEQALRWGVGLAGHEFDLLSWANTLEPAFDPWVEKRDLEHEPYVLFSRRFALASNYEEVRDVAEPMVRELNGAMALTCSAEALRISAIYDFSHPGPRRHVSVIAEGAVLRVYASLPTLTVRRADGTVVPPPPPVPSRPQAWLSNPDHHDIISDLLTHASRSDNWFDVYKLIEAASDLAGGDNKLESLSPGVKAAKTAANFHRHHRTHRPVPLMDLREARSRAFAAARTVLDRPK